jgi:Bardet-Biedl syndrome 2 protein
VVVVRSLLAAMLAVPSSEDERVVRLFVSPPQVNQMIQRAAKLRVGSAKARVVATCRAAIKANNIQALFKIIESGEG